MIIEKVINNNTVSSTIDDEEVIIFGKGIGFNGKVGQEIDRSKIEKTYVLRDEAEKNQMQVLLAEIPYEVIEFGMKACDYITIHLSKKINKRILIPLTDHIYAALSRSKENSNFENSFSLNIRYLYREEYEIASDIVDMIEKEFGVKIAKDEKAFIALHIVNSETNIDLQDTLKVTEIIQLCISTIEEFFGKKLDNSDINFARLMTHLHFFAERMIKETFVNDDIDEEISKHLNLRYPKAYHCARLIGKRLNEKYGWEIEDNEYMYLTIHIARLLK